MDGNYPAIVHEEGGAFWVEFPDLEGCFSQGDTMAEAAANAEEALGTYLSSLMERGLEIPAATDICEAKDEGCTVIRVAVCEKTGGSIMPINKAKNQAELDFYRNNKEKLIEAAKEPLEDSADFAW